MIKRSRKTFAEFVANIEEDVGDKKLARVCQKMECPKRNSIYVVNAKRAKRYIIKAAKKRKVRTAIGRRN